MGFGPIRRARRKHSSKRFVRITARVNPEQVAPPLVKPCQNEYIAPDSNAIERICKSWINLQPGIGRTFPSLFWTAFTRPERGTHDSNRPQKIRGVFHNTTSVFRFGSSVV